MDSGPIKINSIISVGVDAENLHLDCYVGPSEYDTQVIVFPREHFFNIYKWIIDSEPPATHPE